MQQIISTLQHLVSFKGSINYSGSKLSTTEGNRSGTVLRYIQSFQRTTLKNQLTAVRYQLTELVLACLGGILDCQVCVIQIHECPFIKIMSVQVDGKRIRCSTEIKGIIGIVNKQLQLTAIVPPIRNRSYNVTISTGVCLAIKRCHNARHIAVYASVVFYLVVWAFYDLYIADSAVLDFFCVLHICSICVSECIARYKQVTKLNRIRPCYFDLSIVAAAQMGLLRCG